MDTSVFRDMRIVISTPMYRSDVCAAYKRSFTQLCRLLTAAGISYAEHESQDTYLTRARNVLAMYMLDTDATHHLLLDSDMGWNSEDVMRMLYHSVTDTKYEILGAAYPQKTIDWDRVRRAVLQNPDITAEQLEAVAPGKWTFQGIAEGDHDMGLPVELTEGKPHVGTGIMVIRREVYERLQKTGISYTERQSGKRCWRLFHADVDRNSFEWVGEDTWLCREWKKLGGRIWLAPWVRTEHWGPMRIVGDVAKIIDAGAQLPQ